MNSYYEAKLNEIKKDKMQNCAFNSTGNTVVLAGPGSGKTTVLTLKVMQLLENVIIQPRGLACLTYSTEAAREFKDRLRKLGLKKRKNVFLGTVHSFCLSEIIIPFASLYPKYNIPEPICIISEAEKIKLFNEQSYASNLKLADVDKERSRNINGISRVSIESYDDALKAAIHFEELILKKGYLDFTSMVKISVEMIRNEPYIQKSLEAKYPWIIIDEYQDLGKPLHEIVLSLIDSTKIRFFVVGDADQSIYDFQGAAPDYLDELSKRSDIKCIYLKNNYRSSQVIIDASEYVLNSSRGYIASGKLKDYNANLEFHECSMGMDEQYKKTIELINVYHDQGIPYHEIAVLVGNNRAVNDLSKYCSRNDIPVYISRQAFRTTDFIIWVQNCAKWVINKANVSFDEICLEWRKFLDEQFCVDDSDFLIIKKLLYKTLVDSAHFQNDLSNWLKYINEKIEFDKILMASARYPDEIDNLKKLQKSLEENEEALNISFLANLGVPENQVVLSTRHSSKGLEFDIVIMLGMENGSFPSYYDNTQRKFDEARRLCFVAVSRARKACVLVRSKMLQFKGNWYPKEPSPFWIALKEFQEKR